MAGSAAAHTTKTREVGCRKAAPLGARLYRALERLRALRRPEGDEICCRGVTFSQWSLLRILCESGEGAAPMGALAANLGLTPGGVTRCADPLVERGLLNRLQRPGDRRVCCLEPTPEGVKLWRAIVRDCAAREGRLLQRLPEGERAAAVRGIELLAGAAEAERIESAPA
ncbi:MAG: MarR family transcriptional regulator [bacterium]